MNWIGKLVLRKRGLPVPSRFIGWTLFWRGGGLALILGMCSAFIFVLPAALLFHSKSNALVVVALLATLIPFSAMFSYGWATPRVSRMATPGTETAN